MTEQLDLAFARHTDPDTSHEAAASVRDITEKQWSVLRMFPPDRGITDEMLGEVYRSCRKYSPRETPKQSESGLRTRRSELVTLGYVAPAGKVLNAAGRRCIYWTLTPKGRDARQEPTP